MTYGYDEAVSMPIVDLYDDGMMNQYINAVQRDYERGYLEQKQFNLEFGDLMSPSSKLNLAYYDTTRGKVYDFINKALKLGINLTRSVEGRAMISNVINSIPYNKVADWKKDAEAMNMFLRTKAAMIANGTYSDAYLKFYQDRYGLTDIDNYDPYNNQRFDLVAPAEYKSLQQFVDPVFKGVKDSDLTLDQVKLFGIKPNGNYNYKGVSPDMLVKSLETAMPGLRGSDIYDFHRELAKLDLMNRHRNVPYYKPTESEIDKQFVNNAVTTGPTHYTKDADDFAKMAVSHSYDIDTENRKFGHDAALVTIKANAAPNKPTSKGMNDPFVEAVRSNAYGKPGNDISYQYLPESPSASRILPISSGVRLNKRSGKLASYTVLPGEANGKNGKHLFYSYNSATSKGEKVKPLRVGEKWTNVETAFVPAGKLSSKGIYKNGKLVGYRHFIVGQLTRQVPNGTYIDQYSNVQTKYKTVMLNSGKPIAMEVKRKEFNESDMPNTNNY